MKSGIYCITNRTNGKVYIGSAANLAARRRQHFCLLRSGLHPNQHLQAAFTRDGESSFEFTILEEVGLRSLRRREKAWIESKQSWRPEHGYNRSRETSTPRGYRWSAAAKKAQSVRKQGIPWSADRRRAYKPWRWKQSRKAVRRSRAAKLLSYLVLSPDGHRYKVDDLKKFCKAYGLGYPNLSGVSRGWTSQYKGWRCYRALPGETETQAIQRTEQQRLARLPFLRAKANRYFRAHAEACRQRNRLYVQARRKNVTQPKLPASQKEAQNKKRDGPLPG